MFTKDRAAERFNFALPDARPTGPLKAEVEATDTGAERKEPQNVTFLPASSKVSSEPFATDARCVFSFSFARQSLCMCR